VQVVALPKWYLQFWATLPKGLGEVGPHPYMKSANPFFNSGWILFCAGND
jgi:hypothetical protein